MTVPSDGMVITKNTVFQFGTYYLPKGISIVADGVTLDGNGALIIGDGRKEHGVSVNGNNNITIKNLRIQEYYYGIYAKDCRNLAIQKCRITATSETPANVEFLDIWLPATKAYGGGIFLWNVKDSQINDNDLQHQMNGVLIYDCKRLVIQNNLANFNSGWGFHLYGTCDSLFEDNYADFCCRYERREGRTGHMGADAAGFLIVHKSCRNTFRKNNARMGGDGFFLAGLSPSMGLVSCNDNLFEENDGSYSPNIAFEGTFSKRNLYRNNIANRCNYGFWLGFSRDCILEHNEINWNRQAGIATENGFNFEVRRNTFSSNGHGILLWSKHIPEFDAAVPDNNTSYKWLIELNTFTNNQKAIRIAADQDHGIRPLPRTGELGFSAQTPYNHTIRHNHIEGNVVDIELINVKDTQIEEYEFD